MFLVIGNVLSASALGGCKAAIETLEWRDGAQTAGASAKKVKKNLQADLSSEAGKSLVSDVMSALRSNQVLMAAARPAEFSPLLLSKTQAGGGYGEHVDNAVMGAERRKIRTDLSFTLFLSDPEHYEGGALSLDLPGGIQKLKPAAGDLVLYPSTLIHEVEPVESGERLAAVGWIQSDIRSAEQRQILFDLEQVRATLRGRASQGPELLMLDKAISNLLRQWIDI